MNIQGHIQNVRQGIKVMFLISKNPEMARVVNSYVS